jgi:hypothetical protein
LKPVRKISTHEEESNSADWQSAIRQAGSLRYDFYVTDDFRGAHLKFVFSDFYA